MNFHSHATLMLVIFQFLCYIVECVHNLSSQFFAYWCMPYQTILLTIQAIFLILDTSLIIFVFFLPYVLSWVFKLSVFIFSFNEIFKTPYIFHDTFLHNNFKYLYLKLE
jgi:hypothetical protein